MQVKKSPGALGVILFVALVAGGCDRREPATRASSAVPGTGASGVPKVEVKVMADGSLFVDGRPATLESTDRRFAELAQANGVVWYYRESGESEPPATATKVIALVMKHRLPISMSSKPDFSDAVDENGVSHPRRNGG